MPRFLAIFGALLGSGGVLAGAAFLVVRYSAYSEALRIRRGPFAPLLWQISLGSGALVIILSALFGFLLFMLGRTLARVERLEVANRGATRPPDPGLPAPRQESDSREALAAEG